MYNIIINKIKPNCFVLNYINVNGKIKVYYTIYMFVLFFVVVDIFHHDDDDV